MHLGLIGISPRDLDRRIYRIMTVEYLFDLFDTRENVLVNPKKWNDPFENFILGCRFLIANGKAVQVPYHERFFDQCWTTKSQSDALWRIYSPKSASVRVRTTIRKLIGGLSNHLGDSAKFCAFVGQVKYVPKRKLVAHGKTMFTPIEKPTIRDFASTLLFKRSAFSHESEVRLLYFDDPSECDECYRYPVDPVSFIDDILLDPRLDPKRADELAERIRERTQFAGRIARSDLYDPPPGDCCVV